MSEQNYFSGTFPKVQIPPDKLFTAGFYAVNGKWLLFPEDKVKRNAQEVC
jgi:hypothetical protein